MRKRLLILLVAVSFLGFAGVASAGPIFLDNFNTEHGGVADYSTLNYTSFANFTISGGTVDLIGNGYWDLQPGNGLYVDLDGSSWEAGLMLANPIAVTQGAYTLSFQLAGNHRGYAADTVEVHVLLDGSAIATGSILVPESQPFLTYTVLFGIPHTGNLTLDFHNLGGDNVGALLDNIEVNAVPDPASSLLLLGTALAGLATFVRRTRR